MNKAEKRIFWRGFWKELKLISIACSIAAAIGFVFTNGQIIFGKPMDWGSFLVLALAIVFAWTFLSIVTLARQYSESNETK